jgi:hypothetical protein
MGGPVTVAVVVAAAGGGGVEILPVICTGGDEVEVGFWVVVVVPIKLGGTGPPSLGYFEPDSMKPPTYVRTFKKRPMKPWS